MNLHSNKPNYQKTVVSSFVDISQNNNSRIIISISRRTLPFVLTNFDLPTPKNALSIVWLNLTSCLCSGRGRQRICVSTPFIGEKTHRLCIKFIENWPSGYREDQIVNSSAYEDKSYNKGQILIRTAILTLRLRRAKIKHNSCGFFVLMQVK